MADKTTSPSRVWRGNKKPAYAKGYGAVNKNDPPSPTTYAKATVVKRLRRTRRKNKMKAKFITVKGVNRTPCDTVPVTH